MQRKPHRARKAAPKRKVIPHAPKRAVEPDAGAEHRGYDILSRLYGYEVRDDFVDGGLTVPIDGALDWNADPYAEL